MMDLVCVGAVAPEVILEGVDRTRTVSSGRPRVLAFVPDWSIVREGLEAEATIRAELRGLGAELIVLSSHGAWSFRADDDIEWFGTGKPLVAAIARVAKRYGLGEAEAAVFVIDEHDVVRFAHRAHALSASLVDALAVAGQSLLAGREPRTLFTRREWNVTCLVTGFTLAFLGGCKQAAKREPPATTPAATSSDLAITLRVNGKDHALRVDPRASLLDVLRERLGLTGTQKGCDAGQCGSCTVLADGQRVIACLTLAVMAQDKDLVTIEGLADGAELHPMQRAVIEHERLQCGYCTPGQIMSAVALVAEGHAMAESQIRAQMSGNLCRCGAYPNIVTAIQTVLDANATREQEK